MAIAISNIITNFNINSYFRKQFLLKNANSMLATISSHSMICLIPPMAANAIASTYFNHKLFSLSKNECLTCIEFKTIILNMTIGSFVPTGFSWLISYVHADIFKTYSLPKISKKISKKEYLKQFKFIFKKTIVGSHKVLFINYSLQLMITSFILFMQQKQFTETIEPLNFTQNEIEKVKKSIF